MPSLPKIKLYHYPATRSSRVKWLLHELLGDGFEVERVDLYAAEQLGDAFLDKNPNHAVPVLEVTQADGRTQRVLESGALLCWLADAFPEKGMAPPVDGLSLARADYLQMLHFGSTTMDMMLWQLRAQFHMLPDAERDAATRERYLSKFRNEVEPQLVARLEAGPYMCGEHFSAADIPIVHCLLWSLAYGLGQQPAFQEYAQRAMQRPAFQQAYADLGEFSHEPPPDFPRDRFTG